MYQRLRGSIPLLLLPLALFMMGQDGCPGSECVDTDGDGICDEDDACPADAFNDQNEDGVCDSEQGISVAGIPKDFAVLQRDEGLCELPLTVTATEGRYDLLYVLILNTQTGEGVGYDRALHSGETITLAPTLAAGLVDYELEIRAVGPEGDLTVAHRTELACGDLVFIQGQSNAVAADYHGENLANQMQSRWIRSFGSATTDANAVQTDLVWDRADGQVIHDHAMVGTWGLRLASRLLQSEGVPIGILNGAVGGTLISQHQRNDADPERLSTIYGRFLYRARQSGMDQKAPIMIWYQGESDGTANAATYTADFDALTSDWREDFPSLEHIYVFQVRAGCGLIDPVMDATIQLDFYDAGSNLLQSTSTPLYGRQSWSRHTAAAAAPAGSSLLNVIYWPTLAGGLDFDDAGLVDGSGAQRLINPTMEDGAGALPTGWLTFGEGSFDWQRDGGHSGSRYMSVDNAAHLALIFQTVPVTAGEVFEASVWARNQATSPWTDTRETLRDIANSRDDVTLMSTTGTVGFDGCHFHYSGYETLGDRIYNLIARDRYNSGAGGEVEAPDVVDITAVDATHLRVALTPGSGPLTVEPGAERHFYLEGSTVTHAAPDGDGLLLTLDREIDAPTLSWLGHSYDGPAILSAGGAAMVVFMNEEIGG